jgi:hypothetical protein
LRVAEEVAEEVAGSGVPSARQEAMNSCRSGFIRCRIREGPIGSHQELARAEKWESSEAETEWVLVWVLGAILGLVRNWVVGRSARVAFELERRALKGRICPRREAMVLGCLREVLWRFLALVL